MKKDELRIQIGRWLARFTSLGLIGGVTGMPVALATDVGFIRTENQDRLAFAKFKNASGNLLLVGVLCDGMGGMVDGKACAELVVSTFIASCVYHSDSDLKSILTMATYEANDNVFNKYHGASGATLSAFIIDSKDNIEAINVGDSRIYLTTEGVFKQITKDDTIAGQIDNGDNKSDISHQLIQYIGMGYELEPHIIELPKISDISKILLTSDGSHFIAHETLKQIVMPENPPKETARRLINVAKWCGGHDNASALIISELNNLSLANDYIPLGLIQVWDPFGEIQIIQSDSIYSEQKNSLHESGENNITKSLEEISDAEVEAPSEVSSSEKEKLENEVNANKAIKSKRKGKIIKPKEQPSLRIDFE